MFIFILGLRRVKIHRRTKIENRLRLFPILRGFIFSGKSFFPSFERRCEQFMRTLFEEIKSKPEGWGRASNSVEAIDQQKAFKKELNCVGTFQ